MSGFLDDRAGFILDYGNNSAPLILSEFGLNVLDFDFTGKSRYARWLKCLSNWINKN
jgi:hypothetical protein